MLVYANHFELQGNGAEKAILKAIGGWLKEQLSFGLRPDQLIADGEFNGFRGNKRSWLRIHAVVDDQLKLYSWVLKNPDDALSGRQWITEIGFKRDPRETRLSCVVKTDEHSVFAAQAPVMASRPRVIGYVQNNIREAPDAEFSPKVVGAELALVDGTRTSYDILLDQIESPIRDCPLVLVSPTKDGHFLVNAQDLQEKLFGIAQVLALDTRFNSYEMADVLGKTRSCWDGAVNVIFPASPNGTIRNRLFRSEDIVSWGNTQVARISQILAWVTNSTNIFRLRQHIRPEGVMQLSLRLRVRTALRHASGMSIEQLRDELEAAETRADEQEKLFEMMAQECRDREEQISRLEEEARDRDTQLSDIGYKVEALKAQLEQVGGARQERPLQDLDKILDVMERPSPTPRECLHLIQMAYPQNCVVLESALSSSEESTFAQGRQLLNLLRRLVTQYRSEMMEGGGDSKAKAVFGKSEYAAKESETVMSTRSLKKRRTFEYEGQPVEMFRHLKIGVDDDPSRTIRVHFHWDAEKSLVVIGYCGGHLPIASR
jgi:hypothetical protein